ncbi:hypothetical protein [Paeniglutamicibacter sp.]|uniref:hypothetical protein n=1 Tax=Paeniglutamicibacter sp. TaxID=1934391 RepID=UPI003989A568
MSCPDGFLEALRETHDAENLVRVEERWQDLKALRLAEALADEMDAPEVARRLEAFKASRRDLAGIRIDAKRWADKLEAIMTDLKQKEPPAGATAEGSEKPVS